MNYMDTLSEAIEAARRDGFTCTFKMVDTGLECEETGRVFKPEELKIVAHQRFEGISNPDDMSALYLVEARGGIKGMIVDAYGAYSDADLSAFLHRVKVDEHP